MLKRSTIFMLKCEKSEQIVNKKDLLKKDLLNISEQIVKKKENLK